LLFNCRTTILKHNLTSNIVRLSDIEIEVIVMDLLKNISIKAKIVSISVIMVLIIFNISANVIIAHNLMEKDDRVINLAGKQRMLIQKMTKEAFMIKDGRDEYRKNLKETSGQFDRILNGLIYGSEELGLPPAPEGVKPQLFKVKQMWGLFYEKIKIIYTKNPNTPEFKEALNYIENNNMALLTEMDKAVILYDDLYDEKLEFVNNVVIISTMLALLVGIISVIIIKKSVLDYIDELRRVLNELANKNYDVKPNLDFGNDEIGELYYQVKRIIKNLRENENGKK